MHQWMTNKRQRSVEEARRMAGDMRAWLVIGAIFIGTLLVVWMPIISMRCITRSVNSSNARPFAEPVAEPGLHSCGGPGFRRRRQREPGDSADNGKERGCEG